MISVPLILEYEAVAMREANALNMPRYLVESIIDAFSSFGRETRIYFRTRPLLPDPGDEFLVELAVAGHASFIVTYNVRHLAKAVQFGVRVVTPHEYLNRMKAEGK